MEILEKQYASLKGYHSGELVNRVFSDKSVVKNGVMQIFPSFIRIAVSFIGASIILVSMDWRFVILLDLRRLPGVFNRPPVPESHEKTP